MMLSTRLVSMELAVLWEPCSPGYSQSEKANPVIAGLKDGLFLNQCKAVILTIILSVVATAIIAFIVKVTIGLRPGPESETSRARSCDHGEEGYILS